MNKCANLIEFLECLMGLAKILSDTESVLTKHY